MPSYAVINKEGKIISKENFESYGLFVAKTKYEEEKEMLNKYGSKDIVKENYDPAYKLMFDRIPNFFDVYTHEAATKKMIQLNNKEYIVIFFSGQGGGWFGSNAIECDFIVNVFR